MSGMKDLTDMNFPEELLAEVEVTDRRIEELREHREAMRQRIESSTGLARLGHNLNFLLSEKQIVRHIRFFKIYRERIATHYERMFGEEMPAPAEDRPERAPTDSTGR
ncbi:hypothetical protein BH20ACT11_BH20ACT11_13070 [soil metagenome]|jgi:hypothetical protein